MSALDALSWLDDVETSDVSDEAKTLAVFLADGWTGPGSRCRKGAQYVLDFSTFDSYEAIVAAASELRSMGYLTGKGTSVTPWKLYDFRVRRPFMDQLRAEEKVRTEAAELDRKLRKLGNGGWV